MSIERIIFLDHTHFSGATSEAGKYRPSRCTIYGRVMDETDDCVVVVGWECDLAGNNEVFVLLKNAIIERDKLCVDSRETTPNTIVVNSAIILKDDPTITTADPPTTYTREG